MLVAQTQGWKICGSLRPRVGGFDDLELDRKEEVRVWWDARSPYGGGLAAEADQPWVLRLRLEQKRFYVSRWVAAERRGQKMVVFVELSTDGDSYGTPCAGTEDSVSLVGAGNPAPLALAQLGSLPFAPASACQVWACLAAFAAPLVDVPQCAASGGDDAHGPQAAKDTMELG